MSLFEQAAILEKTNQPFAFVTITSAKGSSPRNQGRMIVLTDGSTLGTIGGGPAERQITQEAQECLKKGVSRSVSYRLDSGTSPSSIGMICGGDMSFFIEVFLPKPSLFLAGGGHVNLAVSQLADFLHSPYVIADIRQDMLTEERFPSALDRLLSEDYRGLLKQGVQKGWIKEGTAILIATHNHDESVLEAALRTPSRYIGMLGSKKKVSLLLKRMKEAGFSEKDLNRVYAPVGLDLGTEIPEEIALSIMAEIMQVQSGSSGQPLSLLKKKGAAPLVIVRGAGDLATGTISKLNRCGFRVAALEEDHPTVIRRTVSFAQALFDGKSTVEGTTAVKAETEEEIHRAWGNGEIPILADPSGQWIHRLSPHAVVDAIIAKKNLGTEKEMAPVVIGLGPGFHAGKDVHAVIETNRGHNLGKILLEGSAEPNTGIPGNIAGYTAERVVRSPGSGAVSVVKDIGTLVQKGEILARVAGRDVPSPLEGVVRGMIGEGTKVPEGFKIADVDPRGDSSYCYVISDKARAIAGGVLEAILILNPNLLKEQP